MPISKLHCSVAYHQLVGEKLDTFAHKIEHGIYENPTEFASPPIAEATFTQLITNHHDKYEAYKNGGANQKGPYLTARTALITGLDQTAYYVDALPGLNSDLITLSGFTPTKEGESQAVVPDAPEVDKIEMGGAGILIATCKVVPGADYYGCILTDTPLTDDSGVFFTDGMFRVENFTGKYLLILTKGRKKTISPLRSKEVYWVYFFAGNTAGVSPLGAGQSQLCG